MHNAEQLAVENKRLKAFIYMLADQMMKPDFQKRSASYDCREVANGLKDLSYLDEVPESVM